MKKVVCALMVLIVLLIVSVSSAEEETMFYQTEKGRYQYRILQDGTAMIVAYQGSAATLVIPAEFDGIKVSCIWKNAFYLSDVENVTISEGITGLYEDAFCACRSLESVTLPDSIQMLQNNPFTSCYSLKEMNISPDHPTLEIVDGALINKEDKRLICCLFGSLPADYEIPDGIEIIGKKAFHFCQNLTRITIPGSVKVIDPEAFTQCFQLVSVTISEGVTEIKEEAFRDCDNLLSITFPKTLTIIGEKAFYGCEKLPFVMIPENVTHIRAQAFGACSELQAVILPKSLISIGDNAFGKFTIPGEYYVPQDSYALSYCIENGIPFHIIAD